MFLIIGAIAGTLIGLAIFRNWLGVILGALAGAAVGLFLPGMITAAQLAVLPQVPTPHPDVAFAEADLREAQAQLTVARLNERQAATEGKAAETRARATAIAAGRTTSSPASGSSSAPAAPPAPPVTSVTGSCSAVACTGPAIVENSTTATVYKVDTGVTQSIGGGSGWPLPDQAALDARWPDHRREFLAKGGGRKAIP